MVFVGKRILEKDVVAFCLREKLRESFLSEVQAYEEKQRMVKMNENILTDQKSNMANQPHPYLLPRRQCTNPKHSSHVCPHVCQKQHYHHRSTQTCENTKCFYSSVFSGKLLENEPRPMCKNHDMPQDNSKIIELKEMISAEQHQVCF